MKQYYLPPVMESNARKGYLLPDLDTILGALILYCVKLVKFKGLLFRRPLEKLESFMNIYYPIDIKCIDSNCMAIDPVKNELVLDHGVIGSIAFMLQQPTLKPFIEPYLVISAPDSKYNLDMFVEEYSIPLLKTGAGRYFVAYNAYLIVSNGKHRVVIEPPIYYMVDYPLTKDTVRVYNSLRKYIQRINISERELTNKLVEYRSFITNPYVRKQIETGLKKLFEKKVISPGDSLLAVSILD